MGCPQVSPRVAWPPPPEGTHEPPPATPSFLPTFCHCALYQLLHDSPRSQCTQQVLKIPSTPCASRSLCAPVPRTPSGLSLQPPLRLHQPPGTQAHWHTFTAGAARMPPSGKVESACPTARSPGGHRFRAVSPLRGTLLSGMNTFLQPSLRRASTHAPTPSQAQHLA